VRCGNDVRLGIPKVGTSLRKYEIKGFGGSLGPHLSDFFSSWSSEFLGNAP
jgi:hypothetical protein